jgi:signal transduction histidine kinase
LRRKQGISSTPDDTSEDITSELNRSIEQINTLQTELNHANQKANAFEDRALSNGDALSNEQAEVIASIAQELRQPMSSISGYTDLMINESVGILGALQRKFLERVKASTDRMNHMIGNLIQITTLESGNLSLTPQTIELMDVIDEAIEVTSAQFREKNITLRVDLPQKLPKMNTDKDSLHQMMLHLLQNAGAAVPVEGEIFIKAEASEKKDEEIILIEVTDTGGGIPKEDLPRVFSRLYRADNPLIQGVGDTGVGLSIAKTLTEALGGRIWVESELGVGSTFKVLLPITPQISDTSGG